MLYGTAGVDLQTLTCWQFAAAAGVVWGGNPPFTVTDFLNIYPKFFGPATNISGVSYHSFDNTITGFTSDTIQGLQVGQLLVSPNFKKDAIITEIGTTSISLNCNPLCDGTTFTAYTSPFVPLVVVRTYLTLALASVMFARYQEAWVTCICFFVAHYLTLFMRTESGPNLTASEVASSGLTKGIIISRHAGDVGATSQLIGSYEQWGAWTETQYGEQFISIARALNAGPIWVQ
jgi:hypothetical protein